MGVELARSLFMGIHLQLAPFKWVLYSIKNKVGLYAVLIFRSLISVRFQQYSTTDYKYIYITARSLINLCPYTQNLNFINKLLDNVADKNENNSAKAFMV